MARLSIASKKLSATLSLTVFLVSAALAQSAAIEPNSKAVEEAKLLKVVINEDGMVTDAKILCGADLLAVAALEAARKWRFAPTKLNDVPVKVQGILTFNFTLQ